MDSEDEALYGEKEDTDGRFEPLSINFSAIASATDADDEDLLLYGGAEDMSEAQRLGASAQALLAKAKSSRFATLSVAQIMADLQVRLSGVGILNLGFTSVAPQEVDALPCIGPLIQTSIGEVPAWPTFLAARLANSHVSDAPVSSACSSRGWPEGPQLVKHLFTTSSSLLPF